MNFEEVRGKTSCPICESKTLSFFEKFGTYILARCGFCDIVFSIPMIGMTGDEYVDFYEKENFHQSLAESLTNGQSLFLKRNGKKNYKKKILDVGTSTGLFVYEAKKYGFDSIGLETDERAVVIGKKLFPENVVYKEKLEKFLESGERFDFVTLFEVLEHVEDPLKILEDAKKALQVGGKLAIFVPNRNRSPKLYQEMIDRGIDIPPHHLTKWSKRSLVFVLEKAGFVKIVVKDIGKYRFPFIPGIGVASLVRKKIINDGKKSKLSPDISTAIQYKNKFRILYSLLSKIRLCADRILFFWIDGILKFMGYEKDGLYIEGLKIYE